MTSRHLPKIITHDEHIKAVIYGWRAGGLAMLVATDKRVIYLERRPFFTSTDDVSYEVVAGVRFMDAGLFPSATLNTRMGDYTLTYINPKCARTFVEYIEQRIARLDADAGFGALDEAHKVPTTPLTDEARLFLQNHEIGVLSTADRTGHVHGATVYYLLGEDDNLYFLTKSGTSKAHDMLAHHQVAFTVTDPNAMQTIQVQGYTDIEADFQAKRYIFDELVKPRNYNGGEAHTPPVAQLAAGGFIAFKITPTDVKYADYQQSDRIAPVQPITV